MSAEDAFIQAIVAEPEDDTHRLVFADWLEERGDPRGELIRAQCELARLSRTDPQWQPLKDRERDLLAEHEPQWLADMPPEVQHWTWSRGFLNGIVLTSGLATLAPVKHLFDSHPIYSVEVRNVEDCLLDLLTSPCLDRLSHLHLNCALFEQQKNTGTILRMPELNRLTHLEALGASPWLTEILCNRPEAVPLQSLWIGDLAYGDVERLLEHQSLSEIVSLASPLTLESIELFDLLTAPEVVGRWESLEMSEVTWPGLSRLAEAGKLEALSTYWPETAPPGSFQFPKSLKRLHLMGYGPTRQEHLPSILEVMRKQSCLASLEKLWIEPLGPCSKADVEAIDDTMGQLSAPVLYLGINWDGKGMARFLKAKHLDRVYCLEWDCRGSASKIQSLADCTKLTNLRELKLYCDNGLSVSQLEAIAQAPWFPQLVRLDLSYICLDDEGVKAIFREDYHGRLEELCVEWFGVAAKSLDAINKWPGLRRLRKLNIVDKDPELPAIPQPIHESEQSHSLLREST